MKHSVSVCVGLSLIGFTIISQITCFTFMTCLIRKHRGGQTIVMRSWLFIASALDQTISLIFHMQHHRLIFPSSNIKICIVMRVVSSFSSTCTMMWIVMLAMFYLISTMTKANRVYLNSRFLSHCVTWSWSTVGSVMYAIVIFLTSNAGKSYFEERCWSGIGETVHMYLTHGYEIIALVFLLIVTLITRCRILFGYHLNFKQTKSRRQPEYDLVYDVNILLCLSLFLTAYYCALFTRHIVYPSGSDLSLMIIQSVKALLIDIFMCYLNKYMIAIIKCDLQSTPLNNRSRRSQGSLLSNSSLRTTRSSNTSRFIFD